MNYLYSLKIEDISVHRSRAADLFFNILSFFLSH